MCHINTKRALILFKSSTESFKNKKKSEIFMISYGEKSRPLSLSDRQLHFVNKSQQHHQYGTTRLIFCYFSCYLRLSSSSIHMDKASKVLRR